MLAFLPVPTAVACANDLRLAFAKLMTLAPLSEETKAKMTLSVGVGIGHIMEGMGDLLKLGHDAEKKAKGAELKSSNLDRNALAVIVDKRSGGRREWRARWSDDPKLQLDSDMTALGTSLSKRKVFEIAALLRLLPIPTGSAPFNEFDDVLVGEVGRSLKRIDGGPSGLEPASVGLCLNGSDYRENRRILGAWVDRVLIARTLVDAGPGPRRNGEEQAA